MSSVVVNRYIRWADIRQLLFLTGLATGHILFSRTKFPAVIYIFTFIQSRLLCFKSSFLAGCVVISSLFQLHTA